MTTEELKNIPNPRKEDRLTEEKLRLFDQWKDETNFSYYDGIETLIDTKTRQLFSFNEVYQKFITDTVDSTVDTIPAI